MAEFGKSPLPRRVSKSTSCLLGVIHCELPLFVLPAMSQFIEAEAVNAEGAAGKEDSMILAVGGVALAYYALMAKQAR